MNRLKNRDWELVNAYHDGALGPAEARKLEDRIRTEPALQVALQNVADISRSLGALRPPAAQDARRGSPGAANDNARPAWWLAGGAAAMLVLGVALATLSGAPSALKIHTELARQSATADPSALWRVGSRRTDASPDLSGANLVPVAFRQTRGASVTHYLGPNGCRLSYFHGPHAQPHAALPGQAQVAAWRTGDVFHMIVSTGMDRAKFDAIAAYLKLMTGQQTDRRVPAMLAAATAAAGPCVG